MSHAYLWCVTFFFMLKHFVVAIKAAPKQLREVCGLCMDYLSLMTLIRSSRPVAGLSANKFIV